MHDVAARAGVSHQTVSRVLNGFDGIRAETRDRVLAAIAELGYRRNLAARTLVTSRSRAIGVLALATTDFGPTSSLHAIERATRAAGYQPLITSTTPDAPSVREGLEFLRDQAVEGLVVIAPYQAMLDELDRMPGDLPVVALQTGWAHRVSSSVDQRAGARLAARHLLDLGHTRIQQIAGPAGFLEATVRRRAVDDELRAAGIEPGETIDGDWTADAGYRAGARIDARTTAVMCGNDQMALGLIHALTDAGRRVPADVSVVGFDDIPEAAHSLPPLTTVRQDFGEVGRRAVQHLAQVLDGERDAVAPIEQVTPRLVIRDSTSAV
jgi:DNA-binding LacI/PurR family transcriptional regulator